MKTSEKYLMTLVFAKSKFLVFLVKNVELNFYVI